MAEKKRSCKSTATLPTLNPATPCCPSPSFLLMLLVSIILYRGLLRVVLSPTSFPFFNRGFTSGIYQGMASIFLFSRHVLNLSFPLKLRCGPQRGITITKAHVPIVLCCRDSCGRNSTLASLFLPSCCYLKRRATTLGRPRWPPLCSQRRTRAETTNFHSLTVNRVAHVV